MKYRLCPLDCLRESFTVEQGRLDHGEAISRRRQVRSLVSNSTGRLLICIDNRRIEILLGPGGSASPTLGLAATAEPAVP